MRKVILLATVAMTLLGLAAAPAQARVIVKDGSDYSGYANPGGCKIFVHADQPTELHVNCKDATGPARIRYRYLRDIGVTHGPADFSGTVSRRGGDCTGNNIQWMDPVPRTGRVVIAVGCYVHIETVRWERV